MEKSKRSEGTLTVRMNHEDDYGMNEDSNLSHSVRKSKQEKQSRDENTNRQQRRETTKKKKKERSSMHDASCIDINYAHKCPKCFRSLHTLLEFSLCASCRCTNLFNF